jgi:hypothetical protein
VEILQLKVDKLEQLIKLKNNKIDSLNKKVVRILTHTHSSRRPRHYIVFIFQPLAAIITDTNESSNTTG